MLIFFCTNPKVHEMTKMLYKCANNLFFNELCIRCQTKSEAIYNIKHRTRQESMLIMRKTKSTHEEALQHPKYEYLQWYFPFHFLKHY
jgi:uncharacterized protein (DUF2344 family)